MAPKNHFKSVRLSDEMMELIDRQIGRTFTEKLENLVTRCVWELPAKQAELKELEKELREKWQQVWELSRQARALNEAIDGVLAKRSELETAIKKAAAGQ